MTSPPIQKTAPKYGYKVKSSCARCSLKKYFIEQPILVHWKCGGRGPIQTFVSFIKMQVNCFQLFYKHNIFECAYTSNLFQIRLKKIF